MKYLIALLLFLSIGISAQNKDRHKYDQTERKLWNDLIEKTDEVLRVRIIDGNNEVLFRNDTVNTNWIDTISNFLNKPNFNDTFTEIHEGDFEADDTCDVSYTSSFITTKTFRYYPGKPVPLPIMKTSSYNNLYIKGVNGLVNYTIRLWGL